MSCLPSLSSVRMTEITNVDIRCRFGKNVGVSERKDQGAFRAFGTI